MSRLALQRREGLVRRSKIVNSLEELQPQVTKWIDSIDVATAQSDIGFDNWLPLTTNNGFVPDLSLANCPKKRSKRNLTKEMQNNHAALCNTAQSSL